MQSPPSSCPAVVPVPVPTCHAPFSSNCKLQVGAAGASPENSEASAQPGLLLSSYDPLAAAFWPRVLVHESLDLLN